jgi:hypothetical protein
LTFSRTSYQIPGPCSDSRTFQGLENSLTKFQDFPGCIRTLYHLKYSMCVCAVQPVHTQTTQVTAYSIFCSVCSSKQISCKSVTSAYIGYFLFNSNRRVNTRLKRWAPNLVTSINCYITPVQSIVAVHINPHKLCFKILYGINEQFKTIETCFGKIHSRHHLADH